MNDPTGGYTIAYDNMGRLIGTATQYAFLPGHTYNTINTYDAASNRKTLTPPDSSTNTYVYDTLNRLTDLTSTLTGHFSFGYDALSRRTSLNRPNAVNTAYTYDGLSHLLSVLHKNGSTVLDGATYTYDNAGNRQTKLNSLNSVTEGYTYDPLYQLTQVVQGATTTESYSYDFVGNRLSSVGVPLYSYNTSNELTSNSTGSYTYDNNGSTLTDPSGKSYTWDFENRMTQVVVPGTGTVTFKYDPFGRRIQKSSPSGTTNYLYDGMDIGANIIEEVDSGGNALARYTHGWAVDEPLASMRGPTTSYYQQDGLGSVSSLSSSSATLANTYTYDSFGKLTASAGTLTNPFEYTGREYDKEMNLYFYRARYYDPSVGRFVSEDPLRLKGGIDFYTYVKNRPIMAKDLTGLVLYLCSRPAFWSTRGYGTTGANHSFFLNPETGDNCGMGNGPRSENLQNPNIICTEIPGTDNAQRDAMDCCHQRAASSDWSMAHWKPYFHDCHSLTGDCLSQSGLASPGTPGGRVGCPTCDRGWHHD